MKKAVSTFLVTACFSLVACDGASDVNDNDNDNQEEPATAESAIQSDEANSNMLYLAGYLDVAASSDDGGAFAEVAAKVTADLQAPDCVAIDTDESSYVEFVFTDCTGAGGHLYLNGTLRGQLSLSREGQTWAVEATDFTLGATAMSGSWQIFHPFDPTEPSTWSGTTTIDGRRGSVTSTTEASWAIDGNCIDYDYSAELSHPFGTNGIEGTSIRRCVGECPVRGQVELSYALGASMTWSYNGDETATVTARNGATFDVVLACGR